MSEALRVGNEEAVAKVAEHKRTVGMHHKENAELTKALHDSDWSFVQMKFKELSDQLSNMQNEISKKVEDIQKTLDEQKRSQQTCQRFSQSQVNDIRQMGVVNRKTKLVGESKNETKAWENKNKIMSTLKPIPVDRINCAN